MRAPRGRKAQMKPFMSAPQPELLEALQIPGGHRRAQGPEYPVEIAGGEGPVRRLADRFEERLLGRLSAEIRYVRAAISFQPSRKPVQIDRGILRDVLQVEFQDLHPSREVRKPDVNLLVQAAR